jgi:hypothetical protein
VIKANSLMANLLMTLTVRDSTIHTLKAKWAQLPSEA